jgi:hypothetical protein
MLPAVFSLADHEFTWIWTLIVFYQLLAGSVSFYNSSLVTFTTDVVSVNLDQGEVYNILR